MIHSRMSHSRPLGICPNFLLTQTWPLTSIHSFIKHYCVLSSVLEMGVTQ